MRTMKYMQPAGSTHQFCHCGLDRCRFCDPEYVCMKCGFCPVDEKDPEEHECKRIALGADFEDGEVLVAREEKTMREGKGSGFNLDADGMVDDELPF